MSILYSTDKRIEMGKIKITQTRSAIKKPKDQKATLIALGLRKLHNPVIKENNPVIMGMVAKVKHLVTVEEA